MSEDIQKTGEGSDEYYERGTLPHATKNIPPSDDICIKMEGVNKWYGDFHVLKDINLKVCAGERIVICGPSGSGQKHAHPLPKPLGRTSRRHNLRRRH